MNERDLIGYGKSPPKVRWPGDARIAISVVVNYEEGSERSLLDGDPHHETNNEVPSPVPPDTRDLLNESMFEYGSRAGIWRLLRIFDKHGIPATHFCCALAIERNPEVGKEMVRRGDEVCGHGYRWEEYYAFEKEEERASIIKTLDSLERTTGQRPVGWFTRYGVSVNTRDLLSEIGGFVYDSNAVNDDLPYYTTIHGKPWLVLPYSIEVNDARFWRGGLASTEDFYSYMKDSFDCLYEEGEETPKMMSVGLHCRITGRPPRSRAVDRFLQYAKGHPGVWFARRIDIARWWLENYPPSS
ncbi:MAG: allantoinase PuuE [Chloroflexi bacterium]|nr:allantoinase PuuE [Chloroflexota bacterium]MCZ6891683.1 allantoinase PuuE [Chloroflexota bacterium]